MGLPFPSEGGQVGGETGPGVQQSLESAAVGRRALKWGCLVQVMGRLSSRLTSQHWALTPPSLPAPELQKGVHGHTAGRHCAEKASRRGNAA